MAYEVCAIWAQARDGAIGIDGRLPWRIPGDMRHFLDSTYGDAVVMGRATWESLPKRPLHGRSNIVVSTRVDALDGAVVAKSPAEGIALAGRSRARVWVIGGGRLYRDTLHLVQRVVVTEVDVDVPDADVWAPPLDPSVWKKVNESPWRTSPAGLNYRHVIYRRDKMDPH